MVGAGKNLTHQLVTAGVETMAELVRLCATSSTRASMALGCRRAWYKNRSSAFKGQRIDHTDEPLVGDPSVLVKATGDEFANVLFKLVRNNDDRYRTEFIARCRIPRAEITDNSKDVGAQVALIGEVLSRFQAPLEFLLKIGGGAPKPKRNETVAKRKRTKNIEWRWEVGAVAAGGEHVELRHGDAATASYDDWLPVARVGRPIENVFHVQWLVETDSPKNRAILDDARRDLDFYLVKLEERRSLLVKSDMWKPLGGMGASPPVMMPIAGTGGAMPTPLTSLPSLPQTSWSRALRSTNCTASV